MGTIIYTRHALTVLTERGVLQEWVERAVTQPDSLEVDPSGRGSLLAFRAIPENGGRVLRVVYIPDRGNIRVITAFFDRSRKK